MPKAVEILIYVFAPLAWGVGVAYLFELIRHWRGKRPPREEGR